MTANEIYVNRKTGKQVKVIEVNDKYNTIMYESEDGKTKQATSINFRKSFKPLEQKESTVVSNAIVNDFEKQIAEEKVSSDGTPYNEVMKEIQADEKLAVEKKAKKKAKAEKVVDRREEVFNKFLKFLNSQKNCTVRTCNVPYFVAVKLEGKPYLELRVNKKSYIMNMKESTAITHKFSYVIYNNYYLKAGCKGFELDDFDSLKSLF